MNAARGPNPLLRLDHHALSALHTGPIDLGEDWASKPVLTLCLWFYAPHPAPVQVLANEGHRRWGEPGWSVYLRDGRVVASMRTDRHAVAIDAPLPARDSWRHLVVTIDRQGDSLEAWLDGKGDAWQPAALHLDPTGEAGRQQGLAVGGYTDAAGGHFNYTFGRRAGDRLDDLRLYDQRLAPEEIGAFINPDNRPPMARFSIQAEGDTAPTAVRLDAAASFDPDGRLAAHWWDFGDGTRGEGRVVDHHYAHAGRYPVRLTVLDDDHGQAVAEQILELGGVPAPVRFTPVFVNGEEGYAAFRIPAIVAATNGDLLAFAEGRVESVSDSTRTIRIVCKRSADGGESWGPLQVVGRACFDGEEYAAMYPAPVVDTVLGTGRIVLLFKQMPASEWALAQGKGASRMACVMSDDHGAAWSEARDITDTAHRPDLWRIQIPTAGHAIQLRGAAQNPGPRGRLFYIGSHTNGADSVFDQWNYAFWSDDLGASWQMGPEIACRADGTSAKGLNEATAVELSDGRVLINSRNYRRGRPVGCRALTVGRFDKEGQLHFDAARHAPALIEPPVQASMVRAVWPDPNVPGDRGCILFANPAHDAARVNLTVRASFDDGATWPVAKTIDPGPSAYSDLVVQADGKIGVLYERGNDGGIWYGAFQLNWLTHV